MDSIAVHRPSAMQGQDHQGIPRLAARGSRAALEEVRKVILKNLEKDYEEGMQYGGRPRIRG